MAGYYSRCPSGKSKTKRFISASFLENLPVNQLGFPYSFKIIIREAMLT
jgi:hypothetical protein